MSYRSYRFLPSRGSPRVKFYPQVLTEEDFTCKLFAVNNLRENSSISLKTSILRHRG